MDIYAVLKLIHVAAVIVWLGGGFGLVLIAMAADRRQDRQEFARVLASLVLFAGRILTPAAVVAFASGVVAAWLDWGFDSLWIILGLAGFATTFLTGNILLTPRAKRMSALVASEGLSDKAIAIGRELITLAKFDYTIMFAVVADMVLKPAATDWLILALMAVAVLAAVVFGVLPVVLAGPRSASRSRSGYG